MSHVDSSSQQGGGVSRFRKYGGGASSTNQDCEINIAPIIDCLVVLIAFLLTSLSYLSIHMLDAGVSRASMGAARDADAAGIQVLVQNDGKIKVDQKGARAQTWTLNLEELKPLVEKLKAADVKLTTVALAADDSVDYERMVRVMDDLRKVLPSIQLTGF